MAQEREWEIMQEEQSGVEEGQDIEGDMENLEYWRQKKISINKIDLSDLSLFPFISSYQAEQFIIYRRLLGNFIDVMELQAIPGWDEITIRKFIPFITIADITFSKDQFLKSFREGSHQFIWRSSIKEGSGILGKYQYKTPHFQGGMQFDKDAGEKIWQGNKGISFLSGQVSIHRLGSIRQFIMGDFTINMAQGLLLGLGRTTRKSGMPMMIKRQQPFLTPFRSTDENRFFRGAGIWLTKSRWEFGGFYSKNKLDGNIKSDSVFGDYISSFQTSGIHISEAELMDKNSLELNSVGFMAGYSFSRFKIGIHGVKHIFSLPIFRSAELYNKYAIQGKECHGIGAKVEASIKNMHLFGEAAKDKEGQLAVLAGMLMAVDRRLDVSLLARSIAKEYRSFWASAFTEATEPTDEKGLYIGLSFKPFGGVQLDAYVDWYRSKWVKYQVNAPISGLDQLIMFQCKPDRKTVFYIRYKQEVKTAGAGGDQQAIQQVGESLAAGVRIHLERKLTDTWTWRNRVEWGKQLSVTGVQTRGSIIYSEWFWKDFQKPFSLNTRIMFCETDDYTSRLYAYEQDVKFYGLISAFYGKFLRAYINMNIDIGSNLALQIKLSQNLPLASKTTALRLQMIWKR